jgi:hypothetical protein
MRADAFARMREKYARPGIYEKYIGGGESQGDGAEAQPIIRRNEGESLQDYFARKYGIGTGGGGGAIPGAHNFQGETLTPRQYRQMTGGEMSGRDLMYGMMGMQPRYQWNYETGQYDAPTMQGMLPGYVNRLNQSGGGGNH